ncbi:hypothetical protein E1B25_07995 [Antarcticimicrobium sediminis]|uniref:Uncharacterized protein n=1 Tax=Antarcticimicrobium sediminis TaxID=2546227 RepID=A0A4R5EW31_9RHOB|nr:hypothetical protein [Antarcticimicrobium sediminis]TDE38947.1 hypothetical protein E1B25_07995 [Antarcticimicrobium sediminis]
MFARIAGAILRAVLVAVVVASPSLLLPEASSGTPEVVTLLALLAALLTFAEYNSNYPSIVEFRGAPPLNRMRFAAVATMVLALTLIAKHQVEPSNLTALFSGVGRLIGGLTDFPYSPVRLVVLMLPATTLPEVLDSVRIAAGVTYVIALIVIAAFVFAVRILGWPTMNGSFNVWINLPLFDPTAGGDVVHRLQRDGQINVILGVLLPFAIPAVVKLGSDMIGPLALDDPQTLIWAACAWAFLPASMVMRGVAMLRIGELIEEKRRHAYTPGDGETAQTA